MGARAARAVAAVLVAWGTAAPSQGVRAQADLAGTWKASPLRVRVSVEQWGDDCGPRPPGESTEPGGTVQIHRDGEHLVLSGAVSGRTDRCWTRNHAVTPRSTNHGDGEWRTVCRTPENDPRAERGTYTWRVREGDTLVFEEESRYDWRLKDSRCTATRTAGRTLSRPPRQRGSPADAATTDAGDRIAKLCEPGPPARIRIRPRRATVVPGERLCFRTRVVDLQGCRVRDVDLQWQLRPTGQGGSAALRGRCFRVESQAGAGRTFRVVARHDQLRATARVAVEAGDLSSLIAVASSDDERADRAGAADAGRPEADHVTGVQARAERGAGDGGPSSWHLLGAGAAALALAGLGAVLGLAIRRRRTVAGARSTDPGLAPDRAASPSTLYPSGSERASGAAAPPRDSDGAAPGPAEAPVRMCPLCGTEFGTGTAFCPHDGTAVVDATHGAPSSDGMMCPRCRRGYPAGARFCPQDATELRSYADLVGGEGSTAPNGAPRPRCPTCGARYDPAVRICGYDGAELTPPGA